MKTYQIENVHSAVILGVYKGEDQFAALDAMAAELGARNYFELCAIAPVHCNELLITEVAA